MPKKKAETEKKHLSATERAIKSAELAFDKKAFDIKAIDITKVSSIADCLVIVSGSSDRHVQAIADNIRNGLKKFGKVNDIEGSTEGKWIVMDYGDVLVHIFHEPLRSYYDLDGLWSTGSELPLPAAIVELAKQTNE